MELEPRDAQSPRLTISTLPVVAPEKARGGARFSGNDRDLEGENEDSEPEEGL